MGGEEINKVVVVEKKDNDDDVGALKLIEDLTSKCDVVQGQVLADILTRNSEVEYLKRRGLPKGCTDREIFKLKVPVITYEDLKPDIQRIVNGDCSPNNLCALPFTRFFSSSGTSGGEQRLIPATDEEMPRRLKFYGLLTPVIAQHMEGLDCGKTLWFVFTREESETPSGITVGGVLTCYIKTLFAEQRPSSTYNNAFTSPKEAVLCPHHFQSIYTQLLCGLYQRREVVRVGAAFASTLVTVLHFLRHHYHELCEDIATGKLNAMITDPSLRAHMVKHVVKRAEPELAEFISHACKDENWQGILKKIWPNAKYLDLILTGSMTHYIPVLEHYSGGLPLVSSRYVSSECFFGINLNPLCDPYEVSYTFMPNAAYFEFIPLNDSSNDHSQPQLVDLANVEVGREYELVITTYNGLYRYRVEDVVSPTGFYNSTPQFKFLMRKNVILSIHVDKTTELELQNAIQNTYNILLPFGVRMVDYTSYASVETSPGHYVIFCELSSNDGTALNDVAKEMMEQCCLAIENSFGYPYRYCRIHDKSIGPLEIRVVENGTFDELRTCAISRGASFGQYKVPRCVKLLPMLELLNSRIISTYTSPSMPNCD